MTDGAPADAGTATDGADDLRGFLDFVRTRAAREYLRIDAPLDGHWQLAAVNAALRERMRMPVIEYVDVRGTDMPVVHNVCASLSRVAKSRGWSVAELETRLAHAYDEPVPPALHGHGPVRERVLGADEVDLHALPAIRYTESETHPYVSAAHVVARDPDSGTLNTSFHRLMITGRDAFTIYMTPGGHLDAIFRANAAAGRDTPVAAFVGAHPLWSLGTLAAGPPSLDELGGVVGALLGGPLATVAGLLDPALRVPARAEIALEGELSFSERADEGPYGEAFGFVSGVAERPVFTVRAMSHRTDPIFQDIVPGQLEHLTMTGVAVQVQLRGQLARDFPWITAVHLPVPMTVHLGVPEGGGPVPPREVIAAVLDAHRFVKHVVLFDDAVNLSDARQTQAALALHVQADRDVVTLPDRPGNGLDPSEIGGRTTKWGIDATSRAKHEAPPVGNRLPPAVVEALDLKALLAQATERPPSTSSR